MGSDSSKSENAAADINSSGQINNNNNIIIQQHLEMWKEGRVLVYMLIALRVFEILYVIFKDVYRGMKRSAELKSKGIN